MDELMPGRDPESRRGDVAGPEPELHHLSIHIEHLTVTWTDEVVLVQMRRHKEIVECGGTGLVLVPSVMMPSRGCAVLTEPCAQPTISYAAHGVSETWHRDHADAVAALGALLGQARAQLILELRQPLSTSECAQSRADRQPPRRRTRSAHPDPLGEALAGVG